MSSQETPLKNEEAARANLSYSQTKHIQSASKLRSTMIYEVVRQEGEYELTRPTWSLVVSGIAAGLVLGFSVLAMAILKVKVPATEWHDFIAPLGYTLGFVIAILAKMQLFTENTITVILPLWSRPNWKTVKAIGRLWGLVLLANMLGALIFAAYMAYGGVLDADIAVEFKKVSMHILDFGFAETVGRGVIAGFLIATLVWLMPNSKGQTATMIVALTYVIALGGFAHVVAGAVEAWYIVILGYASFTDAFGGYVLPALIGNILGGTALFTSIAFAQVSSELVRD